MWTLKDIISSVLTVVLMVSQLPFWKWFLSARDSMKDVQTLKEDLDKFKKETREKFAQMETENRTFDDIIAKLNVTIGKLDTTCGHLSETVKGTLLQVQAESGLQREEFIKIISRLLERHGNGN